MSPSADTSPTPAFFSFNDPAPTEIYTLSLHDALPISALPEEGRFTPGRAAVAESRVAGADLEPSPRAGLSPSDRKSTRLNSSHTVISYAVFCLKKKKPQC